MILLVIGFVLFLWWLNWSLYWWKRGVPYLTPLPVLGNCLPLIYLSGIGFFEKMYYTFPNAPYMGFFLLKRPVLLIRDPEIMMEVLEKQAAVFSSHGMHANKGHDPMSQSVFHLNGSEWKMVRSKLSPHFSPSKVRSMISVSAKSVERLIEYLDEKIKNSASKPGIAEVDISETSSLYTTDSTALALFGVDSNAFRDGIDSDFVEFARDLNTSTSMYKVLTNLVSPFIYDFLKINIFTPKVYRFIGELLGKLIQSRLESPLPKPDFLQDMLNVIEKNKEYDEYLVISQGTILWAGGVETSSTTLSFALFELALNQELQNEIRMNLGKEEGHNLIKLVIAETLRKYPIFLILSRSNMEPVELSTGLKLEKNTLVIFPAFSLHRDPKYYKHPEVFNIHREMPKGAYVPFGAGPRICLGMRLALANIERALSTLLERYIFTIGDKCDNPLNIDNKTFLMSVTNGVWLKIETLKKIQ